MSTKKIKCPKNYCPLEWFTTTKQNEQGQCIVNFNRRNYVVDEMIVNEKARIWIYKEMDSFGYARVVQIAKPSLLRKLELGHPKTQLGTYQLVHLTDQAQDDWKQAQVERFFGKTNRIIVGSRNFYRNKVVLHDGGFFHANRKQVIVPQEGQFDLMDIDFQKYKGIEGDLIIRRLDHEISGKSGEDKSVTHTFMGKVFNVGLNSFYQVNTEMMEKVYKKIVEFIPSDAIVFDLFAGAAIIGIHIAHQAKKVYSVELDQSSYADALKNIELNKITNIEVINGDVNEFITNSQVTPDVIIVDPTRNGLSLNASNAINNSNAKRVIYLSCNIRTQIKDISRMTNYEITYIQPYDFFPQTYHIENLVVLDKKE